MKNHQIETKETPKDAERRPFSYNGLEDFLAQKIGSYLIVDLIELEMSSQKAGIPAKNLSIRDTEGTTIGDLELQGFTLDWEGPAGIKKHTAFFAKVSDDGEKVTMPIAVDDIHSFMITPPGINPKAKSPDIIEASA